MTAVQKITLSASRDIPFNKLVLSQANVRRIKAGISIEELAEDIARRGLLQGLSVRPVVDETGAETGIFEIPAGGRRYRALDPMLTEGSVRALDRRVRFISIEAYLDAGGSVLRDLFQGDDGGWREDSALVDRLVAEKLEREAEAIRAEGWKWVEVAPEFTSGSLRPAPCRQ